MRKTARKPSTDPNQEKLRQSKSDWNKQVSEFIDDLIHLKKLMNGWPNKFHMERSYIKNPIPADPVTIIGSLAGDFNDLSQKGNKIVEQQVQYFKGRRRNPNEANPNQTSFSFASKEYNLIANASNPFSRFFKKLDNTTFLDGYEQIQFEYKKSLLNIIPKIIKKINYFQYYLMKSSDESINTASDELGKIFTDFSFIKDQLEIALKEMESLQSEEDEDESDGYGQNISNQNAQQNTDNKPRNINIKNISAEDLDIIDKFNKAHDEYKKYIADPKHLSKINTKVLSEIYTRYMLAPQDQKINVAKRFIEEWKNNKINLLLENVNLESKAQHTLSRWFGKLTHKSSLFDESSAIRLSGYNLSERLKVILNEILNSIEEDQELIEINDKIKEITETLQNLNKIINILKAKYSNKNK
jgi:hypothetical protein